MSVAEKKEKMRINPNTHGLHRAPIRVHNSRDRFLVLSPGDLVSVRAIGEGVWGGQFEVFLTDGIKVDPITGGTSYRWCLLDSPCLLVYRGVRELAHVKGMRQLGFDVEFVTLDGRVVDVYDLTEVTSPRANPEREFAVSKRWHPTAGPSGKALRRIYIELIASPTSTEDERSWM